jgi:thiosulfate/3-mercaptopyruvate sulfurtransferase
MRALIRSSELAQILSYVTLLDVRWQLGRTDGYEQYLADHLPQAQYVDLETELSDPPGTGVGGRHPLPDPQRFAQAMAAKGVRRDTPVVVYDATGGQAAARAWWLLRYHGHPDVRVLDGGLQAWDGAVESGPPELTLSGTFTADPGHLPVLDADGAARVARDGVLIDARAAERYRGETEPVDPVAGRIPGAVNVPTAANLVDGRFRPVDELAGLYPTGGEVGVYCGSGVTAAHDVFALHLLGIDAALYAGSWSDWITDVDRPVATGE